VGWPVVLKLSGHGLVHKKDLGGVITSIKDPESLKSAFINLENIKSQVSSANIKDLTIQIQKEITGGVEVIVGLKYDPTFGPILMFGAGGSFVEIINDKNIALLPLSMVQAKQLVEKSKIYKILKKLSYPMDKLYEALVRVSKLVHVVPEATEVEINPIIITPTDVWAVDAKVVMKTNALPSQPVAKAKGPQYKNAVTLSHETLASKFNHYKFEAAEPLMFEAGQYISVKVADTAIRAYSIATRYDSKHFDLLVDTRPGGPGSQYFENLKAGDVLQYLGPFGKFVLNPNDSSEELLFLATGSGASAVRCMIDVALLEMKMTKKMKLYFGLTSDFEIFWKDHFDELAAKYPNFSYDIALCKPSGEWHGSCGFITELLKKNHTDASKSSAYLCGHRNMIADATDILIAQGCPQERIYTERFV
jgi:NAD(P)H-flavin reductase